MTEKPRNPSTGAQVSPDSATAWLREASRSRISLSFRSPSSGILMPTGISSVWRSRCPMGLAPTRAAMCFAPSGGFRS